MKVRVDFFEVLVDVLVGGFFELLVDGEGHRVHSPSGGVLLGRRVKLFFYVVVKSKLVVLPLVAEVVAPGLVVLQALLESATGVAVVVPHFDQAVRTGAEEHGFLRLVNECNVVYFLVVSFDLDSLFDGRRRHQVGVGMAGEVVGVGGGSLGCALVVVMVVLDAVGVLLLDLVGPEGSNVIVAEEFGEADDADVAVLVAQDDEAVLSGLRVDRVDVGDLRALLDAVHVLPVGHQRVGRSGVVLSRKQVDAALDVAG